MRKAKLLFRRKPVELIITESLETEDGLKRSLSLWHLVALGIGAIVGTGIFVLTGTAAANYAGPALTISFIISAMGCAMAGLCYAEFASMLPIAGSAYAYSYATLGEFVAWFIGWDLVLEYLFAGGTVAVGWSGYVISFLEGIGLHIPAKLAGAPFAHMAGEWSLTGCIINLPAVFIVAILSVLLIRGTRRSAALNNVIVCVKVTVILLFIGFGLWHIDTSNWVPYIPENTGHFGQFGWSGILRGAGVIFFAYIGFDAVSTAAQEAKNPQRDMPRAIIMSLFACTILYVLVTAVMTGIVHYTELSVPAPIALAIDRAGLVWLSPLIKIGAISGLTTVILVMLMGQARIFFSMAHDGLLPKFFSAINKKYQTPSNATFVTCLLASLIAGFLPINVLGEMVSIGTLAAFVIVCISIIVLRKTRPEIKRPFKTPFVPLVPILGLIICGAQMLALPVETWMRLFVWSAVGFSIYFLYGRKHSKMRNRKRRKPENV
ncbi:High-affinity basic amino acid transporter [Elusimicrobium minutum Pei191]|uniref:High-affinity basic amino acid transporter n=1 Tax=Elusimicrobium minutum (strain Pei191) TaxID=445932 RepID=B2KDL4_ELUMP|nr:amino acid permease [Elusimicrobium minutum]ACC98610.1 High-affinity basic amino acid transporter [Elusimicrobium minutum Pei191]